MQLSDIKTWAEIVEIGFKIIALCIAGLWAIFGLVAFERRRSAKRRAVLDISISHEARQDIASPSKYILIINILIANTGVTPAFFQFKDSPVITVRRVAFTNTGVMEFHDEPICLNIQSASDPTKPAISRLIRAGGTSRLTSVVRVPTAGTYAISFRVPMDKENRKAMIEAGAKPERVTAWTALNFACVGLPVPNPVHSPLPANIGPEPDGVNREF